MKECIYSIVFPHSTYQNTISCLSSHAILNWRTWRMWCAHRTETRTFCPCGAKRSLPLDLTTSPTARQSWQASPDGWVDRCHWMGKLTNVTGWVSWRVSLDGWVDVFHWMGELKIWSGGRGKTDIRHFGKYCSYKLAHCAIKDNIYVQ